MNSDMVRMAGAAAIVWVALNGLPGGNLVPSSISRPAYVGSLVALHDASAKMESKDRQGLSDAMEQASIMLAADSAGLIKTTADLQSFVRGTLGFGYTAFASQKYSDVSRLIQSELEAAVGNEITNVDAGKRASVAAKLKDISEAVR